MSQTPRLNELGEFLKARRAELSPRAVGLPDRAGPRRVAGLRREEVAQLVAISTDYYTRMEQGRMVPSAPVLQAVADALHLDEDQRRYLFGLAGKETTKPRRRALQKVQPQLRRVLEDLTNTPAIVMGRRMDVIAWNPLAAALITDFGAVPEKQRNYVRILFTDPAMRTLYADWKSVARTAVAQLRMEAAKYPDDPRLTTLVGELSVQDTDFRQWWAAHHVATLSVGTKVLHHPIAGELSLDWDTLTASTDPDQQLVVWTAEVGSPTHDGLRILASWAARRSPSDAPSHP
ncbi:helix-turn-helix domain-containing protein [Streptomyces sp. NPDC050149]|uniref:helix-turn-helix domain-containing protein n=1 Tax=Streptomyces sp. NPDC050149 TaxID=3365603 RepID=UPI0037B932D2